MTILLPCPSQSKPRKVSSYNETGPERAYHSLSPRCWVQGVLHLGLGIERFIANRVPAFVFGGIDVSPMLQHFLRLISMRRL
jgi:hypothetical protein